MCRSLCLYSRWYLGYPSPEKNDVIIIIVIWYYIYICNLLYVYIYMYVSCHYDFIWFYGCLAGLGKTLICNRNNQLLGAVPVFFKVWIFPDGVPNVEIFQGISLQLVSAGQVLIRTWGWTSRIDTAAQPIFQGLTGKFSHTFSACPAWSVLVLCLKGWGANWVNRSTLVW